MFAAGGTGGHIYPAIAVAKELASRHPEAQIVFVGSKRGMENQIVPSEGFKLLTLELTYFPRKPSIEQVKTALRAAKAVGRAVGMLKEFAPHVVVGTGGYAAGPLLAAAALWDYPTLIHEQNAFPSLTNRWLARFVDKIAVSHEAARTYFPAGKVHVTGNPLRPAILAVEPDEARRRLSLSAENQVLLIVGGSGGAQRLNQVISEAYPELVKGGRVVIHVTGKKYYDDVLSKASKYDKTRLKIIDYATNMPDLLAAADLVISRSGSTTAELAVLGKPSILIPSPIAANDHQLHNARVMEKAGAAIVITEDAFTAEIVVKQVNDILAEPKRLSAMGASSYALALPQATAHICDLVESLL